MALKRDGIISASALRKRAAESDDGMITPEIDADRRQILDGVVGTEQEVLLPPQPTPAETTPSAIPTVIEHETSEAVGLTPEAILERVSRLWRTSMDNFVQIGRELNRANAVWRDPDEFRRRIIDHLPFGEKVASQLKAVARAVDQNLFSASELPNGYSTAYQLTTLTMEEIAEARKLGLLDRDLTRSKIIVFKRNIRSRLHGDFGDATDRMLVYDREKRKRDDLVQRKAELEQEILIISSSIKEAERRMLEIIGP